MIISETSGTILNAPAFELYGQEEEKKKRYEEIFEEIIVKFSPTWERK